MIKDAMTSFCELFYSICPEEFDRAQNSYQEKYAGQKDWISYLMTQWMMQIENW